MTQVKCKICGNLVHNKIFHVKERKINRGEEFLFSECSNCGTLQLLNPPKDMGKYYGDDYYSFHMLGWEKSVLKTLIRKLAYDIIVSPYVRRENIKRTFNFWKIWNGKLKNYMLLVTTQVKKDSAILDVGCGDGQRLFRLAECGFSNLTGIDAFNNNLPKKDVTGVKLMQTTLFDDRLGQYDLITMHHSFEHMNNPDEVLEEVNRHLLPGGSA